MSTASDRDIYDLIAELTGTNKSGMGANESASLGADYTLDEIAPDHSQLQKDASFKKERTTPAQDAELAKKINKDSASLLQEKDSDTAEDVETQLRLLNTKLELLNRKSLKSEIVNELRLSNERILQQVHQSKEAIQLDIARLEASKPKDKDSFIKWLGVLNLMLSALIIGYLFFQKFNQPIIPSQENEVVEKLSSEQPLPQQEDLPNTSIPSKVVNKQATSDEPEDYTPAPNSYSEENELTVTQKNKIPAKPENPQLKKTSHSIKTAKEIPQEENKISTKSNTTNQSAKENEAVYFGED